MNDRAARLYAHNIAYRVLRDYLDKGCLHELYRNASETEAEADADKVADALEKLVTEHARCGGAP